MTFLFICHTQFIINVEMIITQKTVIQGMYLNIRKVVYDKFTVNIMRNDEKLKTFLLRSGKRHGY